MLIFLDHNKVANRAPEGHSLINVYTDTKFADKAMAMNDEQLISWAKEKVETLLPELRGHQDELAYVERWPTMANLNTPGYYRNVNKMVQRLPEKSRIEIAGDMFTKTSQEAAAVWGQRAAEKIEQLNLN